MKLNSAILALAAATLGMAGAQTFNSTSGTSSWNVAGSWTPSGFPNAIGASATFNSPTAAQTINLSSAITVGTLNFTHNGTVLQTLANGTGGSLILDATGSGEAAINVSGTSTLTNGVTISASTTLNDTLRFTNNNVSGTGAATTTMTGAVSGSGGFIKDGLGRFTFSTVAKAYTGATTVNQGRLRMTASGQMTGTSSVTVNSGGSLYLDSGSGIWSFGGGTALVTINGNGDAGSGTGTQGALRNQGSGTNTFANPVALGSNSTIHADGTSTLSLNGAVSGGFTLLKTGGGTLALTNANTGYTGGTTVSNGAVTVSAPSQLGSGVLAFEQTTLNNTSVTLNNATQTISGLSSAFVDVTGTQTQTLNLTGTALTINQAGDTTFGTGAVGTLTSVIAGTGSIVKSGAGKLTLTGANTYTGTTAIDGGILAVNGSLASGSAVTVNAGGTLSGTGTVSGTVTAKSGGIVGPGNSPGVLTTGAASFESGSIFSWELNSDVDHDGVAVDGTRGTNYDGLTSTSLAVASGAIFRVVLTGSADITTGFWDQTQIWDNIFAGTGSFTEATAGQLFNAFEVYDGSTNVTLASASQGNFNFNGSTLTWTAVPEPGSALAGLLLAAGLLRRRRVA